MTIFNRNICSPALRGKTTSNVLLLDLLKYSPRGEILTRISSLKSLSSVQFKSNSYFLIFGFLLALVKSIVSTSRSIRTAIMYFQDSWRGCLIYSYITLCTDVALTTTMKENSTDTSSSEQSFPVATTVAAVVGTSMLLSAFVIIVAFLFCCKSTINSENVDPPEESTSIMSLTDHVEPNNAQVIQNPAILMQEIVTKGKNKFTKMTTSRCQDDNEHLQNGI